TCILEYLQAAEVCAMSAAPDLVPSPLSVREPDADPLETSEWLDAFAAVVAQACAERGRYLLKRLEEHAQQLGVTAQIAPISGYQNTIPLDRQAPHPGDIALEERLIAINRWNALAMVVRANQAYGELGGHIATYA